MSEEDRDQLLRGLHVGLVVDERRAEFAQGDFLVRNVLGAREADGALTVGATVEVGQTLQFQIRDARAADLDLRAALAGRAAAGSLLFTCTGRGQRLFGAPDHDAGAVRDAFGADPRRRRVLRRRARPGGRPQPRPRLHRQPRPVPLSGRARGRRSEPDAAEASSSGASRADRAGRIGAEESSWRRPGSEG